MELVRMSEAATARAKHFAFHPADQVSCRATPTIAKTDPKSSEGTATMAGTSRHPRKESPSFQPWAEHATDPARRRCPSQRADFHRDSSSGAEQTQWLVPTRFAQSTFDGDLSPTDKPSQKHIPPPSRQPRGPRETGRTFAAQTAAKRPRERAKSSKAMPMSRTVATEWDPADCGRGLALRRRPRPSA